MNLANEMARENCLKAHALVIELQTQLEVPEKRRQKAPRLDVWTCYLEAHTAELEFLALDLIAEIEATEAADREIANNRHAAAIARDEARRVEPLKYFLLDLAHKAEREEARKAAMAAWQKLRSAEKAWGTPSERRSRLSPRFDSFEADTYRYIASQYDEMREGIEDEVAWWERQKLRRAA